MKKHQKITLATFTIIGLSLIQVGTVMALDITIDQRGTARFYQNEVLGRNSQNAAAENNLQNHAHPVKTMPLHEKRDIQIQVGKQDARVQLKDKSSQDQGSGKSFSQSEQLSDEQVTVEFPAGRQIQGDSGSAQDSVTDQQRSQYHEQIRQERQERHEEKVLIRNHIRNHERVLEIESRQVKAALRQGAEFMVNPETKQITVVTPSGQEHILNHLPDQAVERLSQLGLHSADELEIETNEEGQPTYQTQASQQRRLFGLFPREVEFDVKLNDVTGEVEADLAQNSTFLSQLLDNLSF